MTNNIDTDYDLLEDLTLGLDDYLTMIEGNLS